MIETFARWDVTEHLRTREDARLYLEACAQEDPGDGSLIRAALRDIARAGNMSRLAREIGMSREGLYKALSEDGNPTFATVMRITRALGMQLRLGVAASGSAPTFSVAQAEGPPVVDGHTRDAGAIVGLVNPGLECRASGSPAAWPEPWLRLGRGAK